MAGLNIDQILRDLERQKTAEEVFADGLQGEVSVEVPAEATPIVEDAPVVEVTETAVATVEEVAPETAVVVEPSTEDSEKVAELQKEAAELDARGRIMARAFMNELEKIANGTEEINEIVEPTEVEKLAEASQVGILTDLYKQIYG